MSPTLSTVTRALTLLLMLAVTAWLFTGCAATMAPSRSQNGDPRSEIAQLEGRIDSLMRGKLGQERSAEPPLEESPPARPPTTAPAPLEPAPEPMATAPPSAPPAKSERTRSRRCARIGEAAEEICYAAQRICQLADEIGDAAAHRSCTRARSDCDRARATDESCR
jgi:hypothetical protein